MDTTHPTGGCAAVAGDRGARSPGIWRCVLVAMSRLVLCLFLAGMARAAEGDPAGSYAFRLYGPDQGLRNQAVTSLAQDREGFLYVGTEDGLFRFDGQQFQRLGTDDGLPSDSVTLLHATAAGQILVATQKGLVAWRGTARDPAANAVLLPQSVVLDIDSSASGELLVATANGFYAGSVRRLHPIAGLPAQAGTAWIADDGRQALFVVAGRLYRRDAAGHWEYRTLPVGATSEAAQAVLEDARGRIWIRGRQMLLRLSRFDAGFEDLTTQLPGAAVQKGELTFDAGGRIWAPSNRGIVVFDGDRRELLDVPHGLPNEWATTVLVDREGSPWVGSEGVQQLQGRLAWTSHTRRQGLPSDTVWAVFRDRRGTLWAATNRGVAHGTAQGWVALPGTEDRSFYAFAESPAGDLWIGGNSGHAGHNTLLWRAHGSGAFRAVPLSSIDGPSTINSLAFGDDGALYVATMANGLQRIVASGATFRAEAVALPGGGADEQVNQLLRDRDGRLWAAGMRGLAMHDRHGWHRYGVADGLREDQVETISQAQDGGVWISYWNVNGLSHAGIDAAGRLAMRHVTAPANLVLDTVYSAGPGLHGELWLGTAMGIKRWWNGRVARFGRADGLPGDDAAANGFWADPDGDVWFGMANGLAHFNARRDAGVPPPPTTVITGVQDGRGRAVRDARGVPWADRALTFHFAALSFLDPARIQRQVRLAGFEDAWRATTINEARYTGLLPGRYRFETRSRLADGRFGPIASRSVVILPPWWLTWWFLLLAALGVGVLASLVLRWRTARLRMHNVQLESLVSERTRDLAAAYQALEEASMVDPLTGLKNRRYLSAFMPEEIARCLRQQRAAAAGRGEDRNIDLCVLMLDLDHFKAVNDTHGHGAGDAVLRQLGEVLRATCRDSDVVVRWGGEEFIVLARNADRQQIHVMAAQLCDSIRNHPFDLGNGVVLHKTCSLGYTAFPLLRDDPERLGWEQSVELADQCLYAAKSSGRDGWVGCLPVQPGSADEGTGTVRDMPGFGPCIVRSSFGDGCDLHWKH